MFAGLAFRLIDSEVFRRTKVLSRLIERTAWAGNRSMRPSLKVLRLYRAIPRRSET